MNELQKTDKVIADFIFSELKRQQNGLEMIASENFTSQSVMDAMGSILTNKYAEGYPGKRYYGGCEFVDSVENVARDRAKKIFNADYANVQPHSGSQANMAVYKTFLKQGDSVLGLDLAHGGHLTHGSKVNFSGEFYNFHSYNVSKDSGRVDFNQLMDTAKKVKPKLIVCGGSSYPRFIEFENFKEIAQSVGAYLMADIAHPSGLIASGLHPSPWPFCDIATTTTHKTLRGPRGGIVLTNNPDHAKKINSAVFPGLQGGPLMHVICAKAVAFGEALKPEFKNYINAVVSNSKVLSDVMLERGLAVVSGGTDTHLVLVDLRPKSLTGKAAERSLENAGITCNKNGVPFDPESPFVTSGIRLGSPAGTSRGFGENEFREIGNLIGDVLDGLSQNPDDNSNVESEVKLKVKALCDKFPIYSQAI